ncbi:hypothetical protein CHCC20335_0351 [Bacillus paralicheniformis]|nr:hypothetical protein CHCC20335_0351 [Bacillus paralicheniformis]
MTPFYNEFFGTDFLDPCPFFVRLKIYFYIFSQFIHIYNMNMMILL